MRVLIRGDEAERLRVRVRADPQRDELAPRRVPPCARLELDRLAVPRAVLHPHGDARQPLEDGLLLVDHDLHLLWEGGRGGVSAAGGSAAEKREGR